MNHHTGRGIAAADSLVSNTEALAHMLYSLLTAHIALLKAQEKPWHYTPQALQGTLAFLAYLFSGMQLEETHLNKMSLSGNQDMSV